MKKRILFVGNHPYGYTGNSHMLKAILDQVDTSLYEYSVYANTERGTLTRFDEVPNYSLIEGGMDGGDPYGKRKLLLFLSKNKVDLLVFIGIDCWVYKDIYREIKELQRTNNFRWVALFPYDLPYIRKDWIQYFQAVEFPYVYSEFGLEILRDKVSNIRYFRPPHYAADKFYPLSKEEKTTVVKENLMKFTPEHFIYGFFGANQFRKDPQRFMYAFSSVREDYMDRRDVGAYFHMDLSGIFHIEQYAEDLGIIDAIMVKKQTWAYSPDELNRFYNAMGCIVNTSTHEGLSWTVLEAMLAGVPVIMSETTAHMDFLKKDVGLGVLCDSLVYVPVITEHGSSFTQSWGCNLSLLVRAMKRLATDDKERERQKERGKEVAKEWLEGVGDFNEVIEDALTKKFEKKVSTSTVLKKEAILFAQHSSGGDVFMTTRCFRGIRKRHPDLPLVYMTSPQYIDIVTNNPYLDAVLPWNPEELNRYKYVYNPHGDRILPGHWGRNSNSLLSDFYWKILQVEPDDFYIETVKPTDADRDIDSVLPEKLPICIVHTTGGDPHFRTYKYMGDVCQMLSKEGYFTIQVGGAKDFFADADLDLRGKLSFRETAWVVNLAEMAVTVDSFLSHLCGAFGISQVVLFGSGNHFVVRPNQVSGTLICMTPDYVRDCPGLGPCSAAVRNCPTPCTGVHNPIEIFNNLMEIKRMEEQA